MKKYFIIISLLFLGYHAQSQVLISLLLGDKLNSDDLEFGLEGGSNFSSISNFDSRKMLSTFALGFYFDIRIKNQFFLNTGVMVKSNMGIDKLTEKDLDMLGTEIFTDPGEYSLRFNSFLVPALVRYKFKNHFYAEVGPQFGLIRKSYVQFNSDYEDQEARIRSYNTDDVNRIDVGAMGGFGYILKKGKGMTIGIKYYYGFVDVMKDIPNTKNSSVLLKFNIPIGREKVVDESAGK